MIVAIHKGWYSAAAQRSRHRLHHLTAGRNLSACPDERGNRPGPRPLGPRQQDRAPRRVEHWHTHHIRPRVAPHRFRVHSDHLAQVPVASAARRRAPPGRSPVPHSCRASGGTRPVRQGPVSGRHPGQRRLSRLLRHRPEQPLRPPHPRPGRSGRRPDGHHPRQRTHRHLHRRPWPRALGPW
jgi:hypothetical protein